MASRGKKKKAIKRQKAFEEYLGKMSSTHTKSTVQMLKDYTRFIDGLR